MNDPRMSNLIRALVRALVEESSTAYEAGLQNCPGPIDEKEARRLIERIVEEQGWTLY